MLSTNLKSLRHLSFYNKFVFLSPIITSLIVIVTIISLSNGAVSTTYQETFNYIFSFVLSSGEIDPIKEKVISNIRLPRIILSILVGASLAVSGASLQGIFKNPMADPGIIGVSSGAAVGAVIILSLGLASYSILMIPIFSFIGGLAAAFIVFLISRLASNSSSSSFNLLVVASFWACAFSSAFSTSPKADKNNCQLEILSIKLEFSCSNISTDFCLIASANPSANAFLYRISILSSNKLIF